MIEKKRSLRKANKQFTFSCFPGGMFMDIASSIYKDYTSYDGKSYATGLVRPKTTALFFSNKDPNKKQLCRIEFKFELTWIDSIKRFKNSITLLINC